MSAMDVSEAMGAMETDAAGAARPVGIAAPVDLQRVSAGQYQPREQEMGWERGDRRGERSRGMGESRGTGRSSWVPLGPVESPAACRSQLAGPSAAPSRRLARRDRLRTGQDGLRRVGSDAVPSSRGVFGVARRPMSSVRCGVSRSDWFVIHCRRVLVMRCPDSD